MISSAVIEPDTALFILFISWPLAMSHTRTFAGVVPDPPSLDTKNCPSREMRTQFVGVGNDIFLIPPAPLPVLRNSTSPSLKGLTNTLKL